MAVGVLTSTTQSDAEGHGGGSSKRKIAEEGGAKEDAGAGVMQKMPTSPSDGAPSAHEREDIDGSLKGNGTAIGTKANNEVNAMTTQADVSPKDVNVTGGNARASSSMHYSIIDDVGAGASGSTFMDEGILTSAETGDPHSLYGSFTWKVPKFQEVSKRELKSSSFSVGPYKWYILVYPNGCDVSNHLSLFLCVADYDKLLPGWSHFAQFTIAVVNKDPKKSKYSDTLHRFCKKEHDWGWKKFMELGKMQDGFVVSDTLVIKVQVQVIKDRLTAPFRTLDCHYRRELIRVYLSNIEGIVRRFIDKTKEKMRGLLKDDAMGEFWRSISQKEKLKLAATPAGPLLKKFTKTFFNEKEVTSTLMMDAAFCAMKVMDCRHKFLIEGKKIPNAEEDSDREDYINPLERYIRSINESWHSLHLDSSKGVFKFENMDFVSPIDALGMFIEPIWMGNLRYIEVNDSTKKNGKTAGGANGDAGAAGNASDGTQSNSQNTSSTSSGMPTSTKGLVDLNLTMFTEEKCFVLPGEIDELKLVTAARLTLEAFAMEHIAEQIESARKEAEIIRMQEELIREEEEAHKDQAAKKAKQAEAEREKKARKREKQRAKQEAERAKQEAEAERKAREEEHRRMEKERMRLELEKKRRQEEAAMEAERQKLLLERERKMKLETAKRERERLEKQQKLLIEKAERERVEKLEKEHQFQQREQRDREQREQEVRSNSNFSDHSRQDSLDGSIAATSDQSGPIRAQSLPTSPVKGSGLSVAAPVSSSVPAPAPVPATGALGGASTTDASSAKAISALKLLLQTRDEEIEQLKQQVDSLQSDLDNALARLRSLSTSGQKDSTPSTPSQNISNLSQQHLASHAYILQQMAMNPSESILGVSALNHQSSASASQQQSAYTASYSMYGVNNSQASPVRQPRGTVSVRAAGVSPSDAPGVTTSVSNAHVADAQAGTDDFDSTFAHLGLVESLLD